MMKTKIIIVIIFGLAYLSSACEEDKEHCHHTIQFNNNSDEIVYIHMGYDSIFFYNLFPNPITEDIYRVDAYSENTLGLQHRNCIEYKFKHGDEVSVFIFDAEILVTTPWDTIGKYYMVLQRYDLMLEDLQKLNWTLSYPPTEAMKNIKMYPPYRK